MKDLSRKCLYNKKKSKVAQGVLVSLSGGSTGIPHFIYFMDVAIFTNVRQDLQPAKRLLLTLLRWPGTEPTVYSRSAYSPVDHFTW